MCSIPTQRVMRGAHRGDHLVAWAAAADRSAATHDSARRCRTLPRISAARYGLGERLSLAKPHRAPHA